MSEAIVFQSSVESIRRMTEGKLSPAVELLGAPESNVVLRAYDPRIRQTSYDVRWRE